MPQDRPAVSKLLVAPCTICCVAQYEGDNSIRSALLAAREESIFLPSFQSRILNESAVASNAQLAFGLSGARDYEKLVVPLCRTQAIIEA